MREWYTLVTGASSGIGKSLAIECARRGMNLAIVALPDSGLEETANWLSANFTIDVRCLSIDLSDDDGPQRVHEWCVNEEIRVKVLINNAGLAGTASFQDSELEYTDQRILVNVRALTLLTRLFLPGLLLFPRAYVLNVGSLSAFYPIPYKSVYAATKAYVLSFSKALAGELKGTGVKVSVLCPNGVITNEGTKARIKAHGLKGRVTTIDSDKLACLALDAMFNGKLVIIPGRINRFLVGLNRFIPTYIQQRIILREFRKEIGVM